MVNPKLVSVVNIRGVYGLDPNTLAKEYGHHEIFPSCSDQEYKKCLEERKMQDEFDKQDKQKIFENIEENTRKRLEKKYTISEN